MANTLLTRLEITRKAIRLFTNSNAFIKSMPRQYDNQYAVSGAKIGATLKVRLPNDYTVTDGPGLSLQDTAEQQTTLTVAPSATSIPASPRRKWRCLSTTTPSASPLRR
jgi:hypothetical protein